MMAAAPRIVPYDASDFASCRALVEAAAQDGLDVLCNISGMLKWGPSLDFRMEDFERILTRQHDQRLCHVPGRPAASDQEQGQHRQHRVDRRACRALPIPSPMPHRSMRWPRSPKSLAIEFAAKGVRVNAICPGHVDTPMGNSAPPPGDVDWALVMRNAPKLVNGTCAPAGYRRAFAYLASDAARKVTGSLLTMDGGQLAG